MLLFSVILDASLLPAGGRTNNPDGFCFHLLRIFFNQAEKFTKCFNTHFFCLKFRSRFISMFRKICTERARTLYTHELRTFFTYILRTLYTLFTLLYKSARTFYTFQCKWCMYSTQSLENFSVFGTFQRIFVQGFQRIPQPICILGCLSNILFLANYFSGSNSHQWVLSGRIHG